MRGVVLHDRTELKPVIGSAMEEDGYIRTSITPPEIYGYGLLEEYSARSFNSPRPDGTAKPQNLDPKVDLLMQRVISRYEGPPYTTNSLLSSGDEMYGFGRLAAHLDSGGSVLFANAYELDFGLANESPETLFSELDANWQQYACDAAKDGLGLLVPPVLGVVLTRCAQRAAIPSVLKDLRNEWSVARRKAWELLDALRSCNSLAEAIEIRNELTKASRLFAPEESEFDTRPVRVFWDITAGIAAGAAIGALSGGRPIVGAVTGGLGQLTRSAPSLLHDFGPALFGRGAFDLARRVRRAVSGIEREALGRLISESERKMLGL